MKLPAAFDAIDTMGDEVADEIVIEPFATVVTVVLVVVLTAIDSDAFG